MTEASPTKRLAAERGSIFTVLLGALAISAALSVATYQLMSGPVATMARVTKKSMADTQMMSASKIAIMDASNASNGDCDNDGSIEPREYDLGTAGTFPTGGGWVPTAMGAPLTDPWNTKYGYCVWDVGTAIKTANACSQDGIAANARRLSGTPYPSVGDPTGDNALSKTVMAVISAGPDRVFQTTCRVYADGSTAATSNVVATPDGSDDVVSRYTYTEAATATSSIWTLKINTPTTATIAKDLEIGPAASPTISMTQSSGTINAAVINATGQITGTGGVKVGAPATCNAGLAGLIKYNSATPGLEFCNGTIFVAVGGGSGTPGGATTQVQFNDANTFAGDALFTWDKTLHDLTISNSVVDANSVITATKNGAGNTGYAGAFNNNGGGGGINVTATTVSGNSIRSVVNGTINGNGVYSSIISASNSGNGVYGLNSGAPNTGSGVYGENNGAGNTGYAGYFKNSAGGAVANFGVSGETNATGAVKAVQGLATGALNTGYAGRFVNSGAGAVANFGVSGETNATGAVKAVQGLATGASNTGYAGYFKNSGGGAVSSTGVYGESTSTGAAIGVRGSVNANANTGYAGYFDNNGSNNTGYAGFFNNAGGGSSVNYGIYVEADSTGANYGVYSVVPISNNAGYAIYGFNSGASNTGYAGYFSNNGGGNVTSYGVYAEANAKMGYGVYSGEWGASNTGYAGYFLNGGGGAVTNYGIYSETNATGAAYGVKGVASGAGNTGYGVYGENASANGYAIGAKGTLRIIDTGDANYVGLKAVGVGTSITYTLPTAPAVADGYVLSTTAAGAMSWINIAAGGGPSSGGGWTDGGTSVTLTTSTDNVGLGTAPGSQLDMSGALTMRGMGTAPATSGASNGRIYVDSTGVFKVSQNNGAYVNLVGGGGSPGGATTQVQFNDAGSFNGDSAFTWNKTAHDLTVLNSVVDGLSVINAEKSGASNTGYAGHFINTGGGAGVGSGLYAETNSTGGDAIDAYSQGANNTGGAGWFSNIGGGAVVNYGVVGQTNSTGAAYGVYGKITGTSNTGYGGYFLNSAGTYALGAKGSLQIIDGASTRFTAFKTSPTATANVTYTLPVADGASGQQLSTNGSGVLSWTAQGSGGGGTPGGATTQIQFNDGGAFNGTADLTFDKNTKVLAYTGTIRDTSDMRLKTDITPLDAADITSRLAQVKTYSFHMKDNPHAPLEMGVMAQELERVFPELVGRASDKMGTMSVNYIGLIAPLIEANRQQQAENAAQQAEIAALLEADKKQQAKIAALQEDMQELKTYTGFGKASLGLILIPAAALGLSFLVFPSRRRNKK